MQRRNFLGALALTTTALNLASCMDDSEAVDSTATATTATQSELASHDGALTLYYEFRLAGPEKARMLAAVDELGLRLRNQAGFLSLALKNTVGDSTMVKNYPANLKGILGTAYRDGFAAGRMPLFYALLIRFQNNAQLQAANVTGWFTQTIEPLLHIYQMQNGAPVKTDLVLDYYQGYFKTVAAGDRNAIYTDAASILAFLKVPQDSPDKGYTTVENHVVIRAAKTAEFNEKVKVLLTTAQNTFRPDFGDADFNAMLDPAGVGQSGSATNSYYRKAVTTEILQNLAVEGDTRSYLMHGVWESVWDHENSHLDSRFMQSSTPVGAYVIEGPVEPFYATERLVV